MKELHGDIELSLEQAAVIARAMMEVAASDGVHQREQEMIDSFYKSCTEAAGEGASPLAAGAYDPAQARSALSSDAHRDSLIKSCYLLALADGDISAAEEARIAEIAADLGVTDDRRSACAKDAKLFLLGRFKGVSIFRDKARDIGRKLGLDDDALDQAL